MNNITKFPKHPRKELMARALSGACPEISEADWLKAMNDISFDPALSGTSNYACFLAHHPNHEEALRGFQLLRAALLKPDDAKTEFDQLFVYMKAIGFDSKQDYRQ